MVEIEIEIEIENDWKIIVYETKICEKENWTNLRHFLLNWKLCSEIIEIRKGNIEAKVLKQNPNFLKHVKEASERHRKIFDIENFPKTIANRKKKKNSLNYFHEIN